VAGPAENFQVMRKLIFASNNRHKADEIKAILGDAFSIATLSESGIKIDIPEPHQTLEENAREKSMTIYQLTQTDCFSEDSGLEVDALGGAPGVHSARYAGSSADTAANNQKLLKELEGKKDRKARFRTVISLIMDGKEYQFEGTCEGYIAETPSGQSGFGYDPLFIPDGFNITFASMSIEQKSAISHRKKAVAAMTHFLTKYTQQSYS
jgi:XTP/dITP diphosphohydrolase